MPGYETRCIDVRIGGLDYRLRALSDKQQFADPLGDSERAGISSAQWSLFGQAWPAGQALAEAMSAWPVAGRRILEVGCGLGLSSLVLKRRGADITASDHHPLAGEFLAHNAALNGLPAIAYRDLQWDGSDDTLGHFDLIIGSDVLYERGHVALLSKLARRHARPACEVVIADPGRGFGNGFSRVMATQGYALTEVRGPFAEGEAPPHRGRLLQYRRGSARPRVQAAS
jgi:predicted nicotinamide N-methyase